MAEMAGDPINPYLPPRSEWVPGPAPGTSTHQQWWFEGETLVVPRFGSLPTDLCVKTGQPTQHPPVTRKLVWVHPLVAISIVSPIIFIILYLIFRRTGELTYGVSPEFIKRRRIGVGLILGAIALFVLSIVTMNEDAMFGALVLLVVGAIAGFVLMTPFQVRKIDHQLIRLKIDDRFRQALAARR
jgi:hypothetical protein